MHCTSIFVKRFLREDFFQPTTRLSSKVWIAVGALRTRENSRKVCHAEVGEGGNQATMTACAR